LDITAELATTSSPPTASTSSQTPSTSSQSSAMKESLKELEELQNLVRTAHTSMSSLHGRDIKHEVQGFNQVRLSTFVQKLSTSISAPKPVEKSMKVTAPIRIPPFTVLPSIIEGTSSSYSSSSSSSSRAEVYLGMYRVVPVREWGSQCAASALFHMLETPCQLLVARDEEGVPVDRELAKEEREAVQRCWQP
jgi:hypothetical protein